MFVFFPPSLKKDLNSYLIKKHARRAACVFTLAWVDSSPKIFLPEHRPRNFASSCESGDEVANKWNCFTIALSVSVKPEWCEQIYHTEHAHFNQKKISTKPEGVMSPSSNKIWNEWKIFHQSELKGRFMQLFSKLSIEWGIYPGLSSKVCCQLLWNILRWNLGCMVVKNNSSHVNMYCWAISQEVRSRQKKKTASPGWEAKMLNNPCFIKLSRSSLGELARCHSSQGHHYLYPQDLSSLTNLEVKTRPGDLKLCFS